MSIFRIFIIITPLPHVHSLLCRKFIVVASISENSTKLGRLTGLKEVVS